MPRDVKDLFAAGDDLCVVKQGDGDAPIVEYAVQISAVRVDLCRRSADFGEVCRSALFESELVDELGRPI